MVTLTALETKTLIDGVFKNPHYQESGWAWLDSVAEYADITGPVFRGVVTGLKKKGMVEHSGNSGRDACLRPTEAASKLLGLPLYNEYWSQPHTPGPWKAEAGNTDLFPEGTLIVHTGMRVIAKLDDIAPEDLASIRANFNLIATAPDLLAALKSILDGGIANPAEVQKAHAAIARAEGAL